MASVIEKDSERATAHAKGEAAEKARVNAEKAAAEKAAKIPVPPLKNN